jgi:hypothetical protein
MILREKRQVCATTWPQRHRGTFTEFGQWLAKGNLSAPTILEVGPGAVTTLLYNQLRPGEGSKLSWWANRYRAFLRNLDGLLRRLPNLELKSYEPGELQTVLPAGAKHIVADISSAVVEAIHNQYPAVEACVYDFAENTYPIPVDGIVCLCVLVRAREPKKIFKNIYLSLKPGGLLVMDNRSCTSFGGPEFPLEKLAGQIWRKP